MNHNGWGQPQQQWPQQQQGQFNQFAQPFQPQGPPNQGFPQNQGYQGRNNKHHNKNKQFNGQQQFQQPNFNHQQPQQQQQFQPPRHQPQQQQQQQRPQFQHQHHPHPPTNAVPIFDGLNRACMRCTDSNCNQRCGLSHSAEEQAEAQRLANLAYSHRQDTVPDFLKNVATAQNSSTSSGELTADELAEIEALGIDVGSISSDTSNNKKNKKNKNNKKFVPPTPESRANERVSYIDGTLRAIMNCTLLASTMTGCIQSVKERKIDPLVTACAVNIGVTAAYVLSATPLKRFILASELKASADLHALAHKAEEAALASALSRKAAAQAAYDAAQANSRATRTSHTSPSASVPDDPSVGDD
jgi:hypothetical protein